VGYVSFTCKSHGQFVYVNFKESGEWEEAEDDAFPAVLAICSDSNTQKKLNRQMRHILSND
jgi:hypothetical protein